MTITANTVTATPSKQVDVVELRTITITKTYVRGSGKKKWVRENKIVSETYEEVFPPEEKGFTYAPNISPQPAPMPSWPVPYNPVQPMTSWGRLDVTSKPLGTS